MSELVDIKLHGILGERFRPEWKLSVNSVGECMRALQVNTNSELFPWFIENDKKGVRYQVLINKRTFVAATPLDIKSPKSITESELCIKIGKLQSIDIVPIIEGSGIFDILTVILGVVLIAIGLIFPALAPFVIPAGLVLLAAGVVNLLSKAPKFDDFREIDGSTGRTSYLFNGPQNVTKEGGPVPVGYGRLIVGSQVISASYVNTYIDAGNVDAANDVLGPGGTVLGAPIEINDTSVDPSLTLSTTAVFTVIKNPYNSRPQNTVDYTTIVLPGDTALPGVHYVAKAGTVIFPASPAGSSTNPYLIQTISIEILPQAANSNLFFTVRLSNPTPYGYLADRDARCTIVTPLRLGLVHAYMLKENSVNDINGTTVKDQIGGKDLTIHGGATLATVGGANGITLNGNSQWLDTAAWSKGGERGEFTIVAWVYYSALTQFGYVLAKEPINNIWTLHNQQWTLYLQQASFGSAGGSFRATNPAPSAGAWHQLAAVYINDATLYFQNSLALYVDGTFSGGYQQGGPATLADDTTILNVGRWDGGNFFAGTVGAIYVYNRVLSAAEISSLYSMKYLF